MKSSYVEKHCVIILRRLLTAPRSLSHSLSLRKLFLTEKTEKGALVPSRAGRSSSLKKVWPLILPGRKSTRKEEHFLPTYTTWLVPLLLLGERNQGLGFLLSCHPPTLPGPAMPSFSDSQRHNEARSAACSSAHYPRYITSTKNSPALPTAMRSDCRDAVSSGGTEASSRPGGAPGAAVDSGGWGGRPGGP